MNQELLLFSLQKQLNLLSIFRGSICCGAWGSVCRGEGGSIYHGERGSICVVFPDYNQRDFDESFDRGLFEFEVSGQMVHINLIYFSEPIRATIMTLLARTISVYKYSNRRLPYNFLFNPDAQKILPTEEFLNAEQILVYGDSILGYDFFTREAVEWEWDIQKLLHKNGSVWISIERLAKFLLRTSSGVNELIVVRGEQIENIIEERLVRGSLCYSREFYQTPNLV